MNHYEVYRRVINKMMNREMKRYGYYGYVFYLTPIQYLVNREVGSKYGIVEIVSVNIKQTITMSQRDKLSKDIKRCLNYINRFIEGNDFKKIYKVEIKSPHKVCSGIIM